MERLLDRIVRRWRRSICWRLRQGAPRRHAISSSLRARYQQELARQQQLRRFLRWLWFSPVLVALHTRLAGTELDAGRPVTARLNCVAAVILCFLVAALNREHGGRMQEQIGIAGPDAGTNKPGLNQF